MFLWTLLLVVLMAAGAYVAGRQRAVGVEVASGGRLHSLPSYHGYLLASGALLGGLALAIVAALTFGLQSPFTAVAAVIGAGLAAVVVMCITTPRDPKEWAVGLISTVMASVAGGSAVVQYMGIQHWANSHFGLIALLGLCFTCGLPGWAVVRWTFNAIRKRDGKGIDEIAQEVRDGLR